MISAIFLTTSFPENRLANVANVCKGHRQRGISDSIAQFHTAREPGTTRFEIASKTEGKAKVIACSWNDIKGQITTESWYSTAKNSCFAPLKNFY